MESMQDGEWKAEVDQANKTLGVQLFSRSLDGYIFLNDKDPQKREQEREAFATLAQEERRAWASGLKHIRQLRESGFDPIPHLNTREITTIIDKVLKRYVKDEFGIQVVRHDPHTPKTEVRKAVYIRPWNETIANNKRDNRKEAAAYMVGAGILSELISLAAILLKTNSADKIPTELLPFMGIVGLVLGGLFYLDQGTYRKTK